MSFNQIDINRFGGLNVNADPTLIQDYEGSDIVNFRMEKLGKLVSRNGNLPGATGFHGDPDAHPNNFLVSNEGVTGIGELILETKWDDFDTDRFMVYFVRGEELHGDGVRQKAGFIFAPLTGSLRNVLLSIETTPPVNDGVGIFDLVGQVEPLGVIGSRELAASEQVNAQSLEQLFIDEFVRMNQYNRQLVISDRINGDMRITDSFDRVEDPTHALKLKENTLYNFDVDVIKFDYQLEANQKNESIENGMALYRYILPKNTTKISDDKFNLTIGDSAWIGSGQATTAQLNRINSLFDRQVEYYSMPGALFHFFVRDYSLYDQDKWPFMRLSWNVEDDFVFTNSNVAEEYDDVMGAIELNKDKYEDEDGNLQEELAADVYVWDELKFDYKPCNGIDSNADGTADDVFFLRDIDRFWTKQTPGIPRITKLNKKVGHGREVPLGTWRYRFVWDFGNGEYSSPTTEVLVQDTLFSALSDSIVDGDNNSVYVRPYLFDASESLNADISAPNNSYSTPSQYYPKIWTNTATSTDLVTGTNTLTNTGLALWKVKDALYDASHRFSGKESTTALLEAETNAATNNLARQVEGDFGTLCTAFFSASTLTMNGFASQYAIYQWNDGNPAVSISKIAVPVFKSNGYDCTYNSVFDDEGRFRKNYAGQDSNSGISLAFESPNDIIGRVIQDTAATPTFPYVDVVANGPLGAGYTGHPITTAAGQNLYLNYFRIVPEAEYPDIGGGSFDDNFPSSMMYDIADGNDMNNKQDFSYNDPDISLSRAKHRPNPILRGVKEESDKLNFVKSTVPTEARRRLILEGVSGIDLISQGETYYLNSGRKFYDTSTPNTLDFTQKRYFRFIANIIRYIGGNFRYFNNKQEEIFIDEIDQVKYSASNLDITIYGEAQRLIALEQLSSYFPASLLFDAPRVRIHIDKEAVPSDAKRLLIFRTVSSNRNEFDPQNFGLVDTVEVLRAEGGEQLSTIYDSGATAVAGEPIFKREEILDDGAEVGEYVRGFSYFDKVRDQNLDYNSSPNDYEGKRDPIKSAFNVPLNERMYYANYLETIVPPAPRGQIKDYEAP